MPAFGSSSLKALSEAHPLLRRLMSTAMGRATPSQDFMILDAQRGRAAQERAFAQGFSKVHYGDSAHNWSPSVALDVAPYPVDWNDKKRFVDLAQKLILPIAKELNIPIRWLGDPNGDGNIADGWDFPHYELTPWRTFAKRDCKPFQP